MKEYLVDVPVLLYVFIRPDTLKRVFEVIKDARPSTLFLVSDGPREYVTSDKDRIAASRKIVEDIDWECKVYKLYSEVNCGMYTTFKKSLDFVFQKVDRIIFLEDDVVISRSFFGYCAELLEKYKDDLRVSRICGMNHMGHYSEPNSDYFFSKAGSIWGFAMWRRTYEAFYDFSYGKDKYLVSRIKENAKENTRFCKALKGYSTSQVFDGHTAGPEFFLVLLMYSQNQLNIIPTKNMVCNIGFTDGSSHTLNDIRKMPKGIQQIFNMETHEYDFPLSHPKYIIEDKNYEEKLKRIMAWNHHLVAFYRSCEGIIRRIYYGDFKILIKKLYSKLQREKTIER